MTREELKEHCKKQIEMCEMWAKAKGENPSGKIYEEHKMILELLEQEPCEDAISRQAVIDELNKWEWQELYLPIHFKENIIDVIPSVNPQEPKAGHWIEHPTEEDYSVCSCCGIGCKIKEHGENADGTEYIEVYSYRFCPYCGARMESEDKE